MLGYRFVSKLVQKLKYDRSLPQPDGRIIINDKNE